MLENVMAAHHAILVPASLLQFPNKILAVTVCIIPTTG
jgi:hypothetical protein